MAFLWLLLGVAVGGVVMFFVFNNNKKKMSQVADNLEKELLEAKNKIVDLSKELTNKDKDSKE